MKFWSPTWGNGVLDYQPERATFTPDGGSPIAIEWAETRTGQANKKSMPRKKADQAEWWQWLTFVSHSGETFSFRRGGQTGLAVTVSV